MAKNNKSGLGRGLNSLMGGYEAPLEQEIRQAKQNQPAQNQNIQSQPPVKKIERQVIREEDLAQDERETIQQDQQPVRKQVAQPKPAEAAQAEKKIEAPVPASTEKKQEIHAAVTPVRNVVASKEYIEEDDGVRIKEVKPRDPVAPLPNASLQSAPVASPAADATADNDVVEDKKALDEIPLHLIKPNPDQPRTNFKPEEIEELAASIEKDGLLQPILVREMGDGYQIIAGERRWQACKSLGLAKVPVRIKEADDLKVLELALIENLQRSDLNPIEEAYGYKRMMERGGKTQSEVAAAVSKGRSTIANALRLLELPEEAQQLLYEEKITAGHARAILSIPTVEGRKKLTDKLIAEKLTVREAEAIARLLAGKPKTPGQEKKPPLPKSFKVAAKNLSESLDTKVRIKSLNGKNKIEIEFKDEDDLQRLFELINA